MSLERKIESSIFLCMPRDLNILGKSCTTFVIVKIVRNLSRGRSPCQRVNHVKSGVIYFSAFIFSYDTIHVSGTIHTWNRGLTVLSYLLSLFSTLSPHGSRPLPRARYNHPQPLSFFARPPPPPMCRQGACKPYAPYGQSCSWKSEGSAMTHE